MADASPDAASHSAAPHHPLVHLEPGRATALVLLLASLSMVGPFTIDTFFPAFPAMQSALSATPYASRSGMDSTARTLMLNLPSAAGRPRASCTTGSASPVMSDNTRTPDVGDGTAFNRLRTACSRRSRPDAADSTSLAADLQPTVTTMSYTDMYTPGGPPVATSASTDFNAVTATHGQCSSPSGRISNDPTSAGSAGHADTFSNASHAPTLSSMWSTSAALTLS